MKRVKIKSLLDNTETSIVPIRKRKSFVVRNVLDVFQLYIDEVTDNYKFLEIHGAIVSQGETVDDADMLLSDGFANRMQQAEASGFEEVFTIKLENQVYKEAVFNTFTNLPKFKQPATVLITVDYIVPEDLPELEFRNLKEAKISLSYITKKLDSPSSMRVKPGEAIAPIKSATGEKKPIIVDGNFQLFAIANSSLPQPEIAWKKEVFRQDLPPQVKYKGYAEETAFVPARSTLYLGCKPSFGDISEQHLEEYQRDRHRYQNAWYLVYAGVVFMATEDGAQSFVSNYTMTMYNTKTFDIKGIEEAGKTRGEALPDIVEYSEKVQGLRTHFGRYFALGLHNPNDFPLRFKMVFSCYMNEFYEKARITSIS